MSSIAAPSGSLAQGPDYAVERHDGVVVCRVWIRSELSDIEAMRMLADKAATLSSLTSEWRTALFLDLRGATTTGGRLPEKRLRGLIRTWHDLGRPVSILVDSDLVQMQAERMVASVGVRDLRVFAAHEDALAWARLAATLEPADLSSPYAPSATAT